MTQRTGTFVDDQLFSKSLNEQINIITYLPYSYSPLYKYNLLIAQDGQDYFNLGRIARISDDLHQSDLIDRTIIIGIPYHDIKDRWEKYHPDGKKHKSYIKFLSHELVPYLDEKYPTYQMGSTRALVGDSLAGTVSLLTGLTYPHTFGKVIMQSPFVNNKVMETVNSFTKPYLLDFYHVVGKKENAVETTNGKIQDFTSANQELHQLMKKSHYNVLYDEFEGNHSWTHWQKDLKQALKFMLRH